VFAGKPEQTEAEDFEKQKISGINVYVDKRNPISPEGLKVLLKGSVKFRRLVVDGFVLY